MNKKIFFKNKNSNLNREQKVCLLVTQSCRKLNNSVRCLRCDLAAPESRRCSSILTNLVTKYARMTTI